MVGILWIVSLFLFCIIIYVCRLEPFENNKEVIEKVKRNTTVMIDYMKKNYPNREETKVLSNLDVNVIQERDYFDKNIAYYRVKNGKERIGLCLNEERNKDSSYVNENTLMYVVIHELCHKLHSGHGESFKKCYVFLLKCASEAGVYVPINYKQYPVIYCSHRIRENPYFDEQ